MSGSHQPFGGIACGPHHAAAAIITPNRTPKTVAEERLSRKKHQGGWPKEAIRILQQLHPQTPKTWGVALQPKLLLHAPPSRLTPLIRRIPTLLSMATGLTSTRKTEVRFLPHHICHAAAAHAASGWDEAAVCVLDAAGEIHSSLMGHIKGGKLHILHQTSLPHSLGYFYAAITEYCGLKIDMEEGTLMAMAALGNPPPQLTQTLKNAVTTSGLDIKLDLSLFQHHLGRRPILSKTALKELKRWGAPRTSPNAPFSQHHFDIAAAAQLVLEEKTLALIRQLKKLTGCKRLILSGGIFLNSRLVGHLRRHSPFQEIFVPPWPHDAGCALGAAILAADLAWKNNALEAFHKWIRPSPGKISPTLPTNLPEATPKLVAEKLASGKTLGVFRPPLELGPRALGGSSILANPFTPNIKNTINRAKGRAWFRPLAPTMSTKAASQTVAEPNPPRWMEGTAQLRTEAALSLSAVSHIDGSCRSQIVSPDEDPWLCELLAEFGKITGVEVLLNTSLNRRGEPMPYSWEDALKIADALGLHYLVVGEKLLKLRS